MPIYEFTQDAINRITETTFSTEDFKERGDLQRLLRDNVEVIAPDTLVIAEEFGEWEDSKRRIDLLGLDRSANLVVIELKRTEDGGHMELQAIRYAAMVSTMTFEHAVRTFGEYLLQAGNTGDDPQTKILEFLGWAEPEEDQFGQDVRIVLASAEFSKELTSSVMWLTTKYELDIRCVRLRPYSLEGRLLVDVQQIIPLPEVADYQVQVKEKARKERSARGSGPDFTRYDVTIGDERYESMWKRNAIFHVTRHICQHGVDPEDIAALFDWRPNRVWYVVEGEVGEEEFEQLAREKAASGGQAFAPRRWFHNEDELVRTNGKTYAFSNQWGGQGWRRGMTLLMESHPEFGIQFTPVE